MGASSARPAVTIQPFRIDIAQDVLDDLQLRLARTRWTDDFGEAGWKYGLSIPRMRELVAYWHDDFDWREQESALNRLHHHRLVMGDGRSIHFVHERGLGPSPMPIVLTHGFPDSFARFIKLMPLLTDPARHGGHEEDAFDVVI